MAYTQTEIDALKEAIALGALEVEFGSGPDKRRIKYRSLSEMRSTLADMTAEVSSSSARPAVTYAEHTRD